MFHVTNWGLYEVPGDRTANGVHFLSSKSAWPGRPDGWIQMGTNKKRRLSGVSTWCYGNTEAEHQI